ncbi:hypothetical protein L916_19370 [Phytophthora nicotianae]|nr:hypothetical protein L916_19370 [Phytophthora nicotianae]
MGHGAEYAHRFAVAAQEGHTHILQYLAEQIDEALFRAAMGARLNTVKWLAERCTFGNFSRIVEMTTKQGQGMVNQDVAAEYGYLGIVKWLHSNRTEDCS